MALLGPKPGKLRPRQTQGPATDRVPDERASGTPNALREDLGRAPQRWLAVGDELVSSVQGIGELRQPFVG
ncbi:hypothetical protein [Streptomyces sp. NBC_00012]|uniref:hypothetical protein n=1 Tax=Streptomyces sp. NBC_00012 TaxID=2975621 RepID=UPI00386AE645